MAQESDRPSIVVQIAPSGTDPTDPHVGATLLGALYPELERSVISELLFTRLFVQHSISQPQITVESKGIEECVLAEVTVQIGQMRIPTLQVHADVEQRRFPENSPSRVAVGMDMLECCPSLLASARRWEATSSGHK